jgi:hypothetical protein
VTFENRETFPKLAKKINKSPSCLFRWHAYGVRGVRLQALRLGRTLYSSTTAIEAFGRDVARAAQGGNTTPDDDAL